MTLAHMLEQREEIGEEGFDDVKKVIVDREYRESLYKLYENIHKCRIGKENSEWI